MKDHKEGTGQSRGIVIYNPDVAADPLRPATPTTTRTSLPDLDFARRLDLRIAFDFNSALIRPESLPELAELCAAVESLNHRSFYVVGHTDAQGSIAYNHRLSWMRAKSVVAELERSCPVYLDLVPIGMGEDRLLPGFAPNAAEQRRVEFIVKIPPTS